MECILVATPFPTSAIRRPRNRFGARDWELVQTVAARERFRSLQGLRGQVVEVDGVVREAPGIPGGTSDFAVGSIRHASRYPASHGVVRWPPSGIGSGSAQCGMGESQESVRREDRQHCRPR